MKAFRFRLDRVLDWYRNQFQIEQTRFATALASLHAVEQAIARFHAECLSIERDVIGRATIPARDFQALGLYRLRARKMEAGFNQERTRRERAVREQTQRLQDAQRRLRLLEKLRERRREEHVYLEERELEAVAAEAYLAQWTGPKHTVAPPGHDGSQP